MNRVGDMAFSLGLLLCIGLFYDLSMPTLFSLASYYNSDALFIFCMFLLIASAAKSAQLG